MTRFQTHPRRTQGCCLQSRTPNSLVQNKHHCQPRSPWRTVGWKVNDGALYTDTRPFDTEDLNPSGHLRAHQYRIFDAAALHASVSQHTDSTLVMLAAPRRKESRCCSFQLKTGRAPTRGRASGFQWQRGPNTRDLFLDRHHVQPGSVVLIERYVQIACRTPDQQQPVYQV